MRHSQIGVQPDTGNTGGNILGVTQQLSIKIPDELDARLRAAAGGNVSQ
jgi:hypothetical protein